MTCLRERKRSYYHGLLVQQLQQLQQLQQRMKLQPLQLLRSSSVHLKRPPRPHLWQSLQPCLQRHPRHRFSSCDAFSFWALSASCAGKGRGVNEKNRGDESQWSNDRGPASRSVGLLTYLTECLLYP